MYKAQVIILDFGSQYSSLVARIIRDLGVFCEIMPYNTEVNFIIEKNPKAIIFSGGPYSVYEDSALLISKNFFNINIPILGICYGMQLIVHLLGGIVKPNKKEYGKAYINIFGSNKNLFLNVPNKTQVWMSHGDCVTQLPDNFDILAKSNDVIAAIKHKYKDIYGIQFHPEVSHSNCGKQLISNFLFNISNCVKDWYMDDYINVKLKDIQKTVGSSNVVLGLSGGIDSTVAAALIHKAIGKQLTCVFVDTGLLRKNEMLQVQHVYSQKFNLNIIYVDAKINFLKALKGVVDPENKRKTIGYEFINTFKNTVKTLSNINFLAQGTIYPDIIESCQNSNISTVIKSHHNVGGLPNDLGLKLLEPLKFLFKDEVRSIGKILDLPDTILYRHPFPGPGLGIRIIGEITKEKITMLQDADAIFIDELINAGWYKKVSQAFVILLPVRSVGVKGDNRSYELTAVLRCVNTTNFMTAEVSQLPFSLIEKVVIRIVNEVNGINRVLYDFTTKPPATIEWE